LLRGVGRLHVFFQLLLDSLSEAGLVDEPYSSASG
jgi:hypothetical protein